MYKKLNIDLHEKIFLNGRYDVKNWKDNKNIKVEINNLIIPGFETFYEKTWAIWSSTFIRPMCVMCNNLTNFKHVSSGYYRYCSRKCAAIDPIRDEKIKQTELERYGGHHMFTKSSQDKMRMIGKEKYNGHWPGSFATKEYKDSIKEKYGVDNISNLPEIKNKIKQTCLERYGVDNPRKADLIKKKINDTNINRYGGISPLHSNNIKEKYKQTCLERYGVDNPQKSKDILLKTRNTMLDRYGVEYPFQSPIIMYKALSNIKRSSFKFKKYISLSGKIYECRGYESYILKYLLDAGIDDSDLFCGINNVPVISYEYNGKNRKYFPDIFIKSKNMLIDVKSIYIFDREVEKNLTKQKYSKNAGFHHIIIIWDEKQNYILETY